MHTPVPEVPVADDPDRFGVGRPNGEGGAGHAFVGTRVCTEHLPQAAVAALVEQVKVEVTESGPMAVRVVEDEARRTRAAVDGLETVAAAAGSSGCLPQAARVDLAHRDPLQDGAVRGRAR